MIGMVTGVAGARAAKVMTNKELGSWDNRKAASKEHIKNDVKTLFKSTAIAGTAVGGFMAHKSGALKKVANSTTTKQLLNYAKKLATKFTKKFPKLAGKLTKTANNIAPIVTEFGKRVASTFGKLANVVEKNPKTALLAAGVALMLGIVGRKARYNEGKIDQKYADKANTEKTNDGKVEA